MASLRGAWWVVGTLALGVAVSVAARPLELWALRGLYQFGEWVGITPVPPAAGASWGGQVAGFTFARPPNWWGFTSGVLAVMVALMPLFAALLWVHAQRWHEARRPRVRWLLCAAAAGGLVAGVAHRLGEWTLLRASVDVFEWMGGEVPRISGMIGMGPNGPFSGDGWADRAGNWAVRWVPWLAPAMAGAVVAMVVSALGRRATLATACVGCGYDRRGIGRDGPCPECGAGPGPAAG